MNGPTEAELAEIRAAARRREHPETLTDRLRQLREENEQLRGQVSGLRAQLEAAEQQLAYLRRERAEQRAETWQRPDMARHVEAMARYVETLPGHGSWRMEFDPAWRVPLPPLLKLAERVLVRTWDGTSSLRTARVEESDPRRDLVDAIGMAFTPKPQPVRIDDPYADLWRAFRKEPEL